MSVVETERDVTAAPPAPGGERQRQDGERPDEGYAAVLFACASVALATAAAGWMLSGVFTGVPARLTGLLVALVGPAMVASSYRTARPAVLQYLAAPVVVGIGALLALPGTSGGSANLPSLVVAAVRDGGLGQPPVGFDPGWRFLLVLVVGLLGAGSASLAAASRRPKLALAPSLLVVVAASLVQPPSSAVTASTVALVLMVAALTVGYGARRHGASGSFELLRLLRGAGGLAALAVVLVLLGNAGFLFPGQDKNDVVPAQPPKPAPPLSDRVLFTVDGTATGPWQVGVLDGYDGTQWLLPPYDRNRLSDVRSGAPLPGAPPSTPGTDPTAVTIHVGDLPGRQLPTVDGAESITPTGGLSVQFDPRTQQLFAGGGRADPGSTYTVRAAATPTGTDLAQAGPAPVSMAAFRSAPPPPADVARLIAAAPGPDGFDRLQWVRTRLFTHVVAAGRGVPEPVPPARVSEMLAGGHATPYEITAAEALLTRWLGIPARIGFGYYGGARTADGHAREVRPRDGATWLEAWFAGTGWVSIVGRPAQAVTTTSLSEHQHDPQVHTNGQLALVVHVPVQLASLHQLYQDIRWWALFALPWLVLLVAAVVFYPAGFKAARRWRRRRWAAAHGDPGRLLVAYANLRDRLRDVNSPQPNATPLEFCSVVEYDDEHWELAWLVTRGLWGDLARDLRRDDAIAAEEMARSVGRRVLRAQRLGTRVAGLASRSSLRSPWTLDVPNCWPSGRLRRRVRAALRSVRTAAGAGVRRAIRTVRVRGRRPVPAAAALALVAALVGLTGCAAPPAGPPAALPARFVPEGIGGYAVHRMPVAERAFARAGSASLVTGGRVWTVVAPDGSVVGSIQAAAFRPDLHRDINDVQRGVRESIGSGDFTPERLGATPVYTLSQSEERLLLYFPPGGRYYELLDARNDFRDADRLFAALIAYQSGTVARPLPVALDPRRGGD